MEFDSWLAECRAEFMRRLHCSADYADKVIAGVGLDIYRHQHARGLTPNECIGRELAFWCD
jgi:hypothetical protein